MNSEKPRQLPPVLLMAACAFLAITSHAFPQYIPPDEEAPEALLQTELASSEVELLATGYWEAELMGSLGYAFPADGEPFPTSFPGMTQGVAFTQKPDLLLSLWIQQRFFFETSIIAGYEINSLQMGYVNPDEGFLRSIILGTPGPSITDYAEVVIPEGSTGSFGVSIEMATEISKHEAMLRIEDFGYRRQSFLGDREIRETALAPADYMSGTYFVLPDAGLDFIEVYVETTPTLSSGGVTDTDGRRYAPAETASVVASATEGTIRFLEPPDTRILVYYEKTSGASTVPVGDISLGVAALTGSSDGSFPDPDAPAEQFWFEPTGTTTHLGTPLIDYRVSLSDGTDLLLLYEPGEYSPFEHAGWYAAGENLPDETWNVEVSLGNPSDPSADTPFQFEASVFDDSEFRIFSTTSDPRSVRERYPFASIYPELYGPFRDSIDRDRELIIRYLSEAGGILLESPLSGSVTIRRNGFRETGFEVDGSGAVTLAPPPQPGDRIDVSYRTESAGEEARNLTFGLSNSFDVAEGISVYSILSGLWDMGSRSFSTRPEEHPGGLTFGTGIEIERERFQASLDTSISIESPDTSGSYRIFGMEGADVSYSPSRTTVVPASRPADSVITLGPVRGTLVYKDYYTDSAGGGEVLMDYTSDIEGDKIFDITDGAPAGPYVAATVLNAILVDDVVTPVEGDIMIVEYDVSGGADWVGAQLNLSPGGAPPDLSDFEGFYFYWTDESWTTSSPHPRYHVQLGAIGEDLDGDSILDAESSEFDGGYEFDDLDNGVTLRVGGWEGNPDLSISTEDVNANGVLDRENGNLVLNTTYDDGSASYPINTWRKVEVRFTGADAAKLRAVSGLRIVVERTGADPVSGKLLLTGPTFFGSPLRLEPVATGTAKVSEETDSTLGEAFRSTIDRFHPADEEQRVLEFNWSSIDAGAGWSATGVFPSAPISDYRSLSFYLRGVTTGESGPAVFSMSFGTAAEEAASLTFTGDIGDAWSEYTVDLTNAVLLKDGVEVAGAAVDVDASVSAVNTISIACTGVSSGTVALDEIHLSTSVIETKFSTQGFFGFSSAGPVIEIGSFPVVGAVSVSQKAQAAGNALETGGTRFSAASETKGSIVLANSLDISADVAVTWEENQSDIEAGHSVVLPAVDFPVRVTDDFRAAAGESSYSHKTAVRATAGRLGELTAGAESSLSDATLLQSWNGNLAILPDVLNITLAVQARQAAVEYVSTDAGYFETYAGSFRMISPSALPGANARSAGVETGLAVAGERVGFDTSQELWYRVTGFESDILETGGYFTAGIPLSFATVLPPGIKIEPRYELNFSNTAGGYDGGSIGDDLGAVWAGLAARNYLVTGPVYDLFSLPLVQGFSAETAGDSFGEYSPTLAVTFSRGFGSYVRDLFVPSTAEVGLSRSLRRLEDEVFDDLAVDAQLRATALNLFGSRGVKPVFSIYSSDEYSWSLRGGVYFSDGGFTHFTTLLQNYLFFEGGGEEQFTIDNRFEISTETDFSWKEALDTAFIWRTPVEKPISLPVLNIVFEKDVYFMHEESLELDLSADSFELRLGHKSELVLGDTGSISALLHLGTAHEESVWFLGVEGGVKARISF